MQTKAIVLLLLFACMTGSPACAAGAWTPAKSDKVNDLVGLFLKRHGPLPQQRPPPAMSVGVAVNGALVVADGWGDARPGVKADANTVYRIGSLTKQFTAAAVLGLIDRDQRSAMPLTLDRPLRELLDGVEDWEFAGAPPLTVRTLLTMTSNLPSYTRAPPASADPWGAIPADKLLSEVKKLRPTAWPNSFAYSNTSYFLLAEIIEMHSGAEGVRGNYRDYLRRTLFEPAGMTSTGFGDTSGVGVIAMPHYRRPPTFVQPNWLKGSGDMTSNVVDLFQWDKALMEGRVVATNVRDLMFAPHAAVSPRLSYGMGFYVEHPEHLDIYSHSGTVPGYTAFNVIVRERGKPDWISVSILTNSDGVEDLQRLADAIVIVALDW